MQVIMREMNQYLYREVNTLQVSTYVDIDRDSSSATATTTTATNRTMESYLADVQQNSYQVLNSFGKVLVKLALLIKIRIIALKLFGK